MHVGPQGARDAHLQSKKNGADTAGMAGYENPHAPGWREGACEVLGSDADFQYLDLQH